MTIALNPALSVFALPFGRAPHSLVEHARTFSTAVLDPFGQIFLRMLFFVVVPLVFASLAGDVVQPGNRLEATAKTRRLQEFSGAVDTQLGEKNRRNHALASFNKRAPWSSPVFRAARCR